MEIYNEEINDLFAVDNKKLQIHESLEVSHFLFEIKFCHSYKVADLHFLF